MMEVAVTWNDLFDIATTPATTADEGCRIGPDILRLTRKVMKGARPLGSVLKSDSFRAKGILDTPDETDSERRAAVYLASCGT